MSSKWKALCLALVCATMASACYFLTTGRVSNRITMRVAHPTVDRMDRLVLVEEGKKLHRFRHLNGSTQRDGEWRIPAGTILDIAADNIPRGIEGNGVWVLVGFPNGRMNLTQYTLENFPTAMTAHWRVPANDLAVFTQIHDIAAGAYNSLYIVGHHRDYGEVVAMCSVPQGSNGDCKNFVFQNQRGDAPGVLTEPSHVTVDWHTHEVYVVDNWSTGIDQPIRAHVMMYGSLLQPSNIAATELRADATLAVRERYVVALDGTGRNLWLRSFQRPGPSEADRTLEPLSTYRSTDYAEAIATGKRRSEHCGYFWELRTPRTQVVSYEAIFHPFGSNCTPQ